MFFNPRHLINCLNCQAYDILQNLFSSWHTLSVEAEACAICDALIHISKEDKREIRRKAEDEKVSGIIIEYKHASDIELLIHLQAKLKHMHDNALTGGTLDLENVPCAIVLAQFVRSWKHWLARPADALRPEMVDNSSLMCEHGMLLFDPNSPGDLNTSITMIKRSDWDVLEDL